MDGCSSDSCFSVKKKWCPFSSRTRKMSLFWLLVSQAKVTWSGKSTVQEYKTSSMKVYNWTSSKYLNSFSDLSMEISKNATKQHFLLNISIFTSIFWKYWRNINNSCQDLSWTGSFWLKVWSHSSWVINVQKQDWIHLLIRLHKAILEFWTKCSIKIPWVWWFLLSNISSAILSSLKLDRINSRTATQEKRATSCFIEFAVWEMKKEILQGWRNCLELASRMYTKKCQQIELQVTASHHISTATMKPDQR